MPHPDSHELVYPYAEPVISGLIKSRPEDFKVTEQLGFEPSGHGEHLFIYVQKSALTTRQLIEQIARDIGLHPRAIGYSGLKDKQAVTCQWLSLHLPGCRQAPVFAENQHYQVLTTAWHDKKLRIGVHRCNHFELTVRHLEGQVDRLPELIEQIRMHGFANYFGVQRFGRQGDNVQQAVRALANRHKRKRLNRAKKSLYVSALRSELFNQILSRRIRQHIWQRPLNGDAFMLDGSQSLFNAEIDADIMRRYHQLDIHTAISLYGLGESRISAHAGEIEDQVIKAHPQIAQLLEALEIQRGYRANRAIAGDLQFTVERDQGLLKLRVVLAKGSYMTSLLNHFIDIDDPHGQV